MLTGRNTDIALGMLAAVVFLRYGDEIPVVSMLHKPIIEFVNTVN